MLAMKTSLDNSPSFESTMLWAACVLIFFFGFMSGEFTVPSSSAFNPSVHLTQADVSVDSDHNPTKLAVIVKFKDRPDG